MKAEFVRNNLPGQNASIDTSSENNEVIGCLRDMKALSADVNWGSYLFAIMMLLTEMEDWEREHIFKTVPFFVEMEKSGELDGGTIQ